MRRDEVEELSRQLRKFHRRLRREITGVPGLSSSAVRVLGAVARSERGAHPSQLAADLVMTSSNVAAALRALTARSLVERQPMPADTRKVLVTLTAAGADLVAARRAARDSWLVEALAGLDDDELATLSRAGRLLDRIAEQVPAAGGAA